MLGITGDKDCLVIKDGYSGLRAFYPTPTKDAKETVAKLQHFSGDRMIKRLYSDRSGEIGSALKTLRIMPENSTPGEPANNSVAERNNEYMLDGIRVSLSCAGLPACFWVFAGPHFALMSNTECTATHPSPWYHTHGSEFHGQRIPFGARITYRPAETKGIEPSKMECPNRTGIFAGYHLKPGYSWSGEYLIWDLDDFIGVNLAADAPASTIGRKLGYAHVTKTVEVPDEKWGFPLQARHEYFNHTLEGREELAKMGHFQGGVAPFQAPPNHVDVQPEASGVPPIAPGGSSAQGSGGGAPPLPAHFDPSAEYSFRDGQWFKKDKSKRWYNIDAVSYTHLTLPTSDLV